MLSSTFLLKEEPDIWLALFLFNMVVSPVPYACAPWLLSPLITDAPLVALPPVVNRGFVAIFRAPGFRSSFYGGAAPPGSGALLIYCLFWMASSFYSSSFPSWSSLRSSTNFFLSFLNMKPFGLELPPIIGFDAELEPPPLLKT